MLSDNKKFDWNTVGLDFGNWEEEKVWALDLPTQEMDIKEFFWLFNVPFWEADNGERYTVTPQNVIDRIEGTSKEYEAVEKCDLSYPIDIINNKGRWYVLDGLHRLVKAYIKGHNTVNVRVVPRERFDEVKSEHPIELPNY